MDTRVLLFLVVVSSFWCSQARDLPEFLLPYGKFSEGEVRPAEKVTKDQNLCTLCEEFASQALNYLNENKTQTEIISSLHKSCSKIPSFKQQCIVLVDYYAPLFFLEVSSVQPENFCRKVALCGKDISVPQQLSKDTCDLCHDALTEALLKLKDPDTELEIVELLLKACTKLDKAVKKCKRLVFEYAPIILINAAEFLEKTDVCTLLHACDAAPANSDSMHAAS